MFDKRSAAVGGNSDETVAQALQRYITQTRFSTNKLEFETGISSRQIRRYINEGFTPDLDCIAAFSIALKLPFSSFEHLMKCAGLQLDNSPRSALLRILLTAASVSDLTVMKCNFILKLKGFNPLSEIEE